MSIKPESKNYYFTFGTSPLYPHGPRDFVVVRACDDAEAARKFREVYPNRKGSDVLNCAWVYYENEWEDVYERFYKGRQPVRVIM